MKINQNFNKIEDSYLFSTVAKKRADFLQANPGKKVISLGIGDVTLPLCDSVVNAMTKAVAEMGKKETFRGYGQEQGYDFLHRAICGYYAKRNVTLDDKEVFVSDGAKSDLGNILDLFAPDNIVLIPDPVYPVYVDTNIMAGRKVIFMEANQENDFLPLPDDSVNADIIYLCSPNNPTGAAYNRDQLKKWVDYANKKNALILFDAAYESFIESEDVPHSIFEIEGARTCAIEFCSFSKTAGFTGTRCGYTIIPLELSFENSSINKMWLRRQTTKFNGVPYIVQRGAEAVFTDEGMEQILRNIAYYKENAKIIAETMTKHNIWYTGGKNSPYIWMRCPDGYTSWEFFDKLLNEANVVGTPGAGFGKNGENYFRFTAFGNREDTIEAMSRLAKIIG